jgi:opacity protein-like surface antigen
VVFAIVMRVRLVAILACACTLAAAQSASAYERQQHFGLAGGGVLSDTDSAKTRAGIDLGLHYTYGVTDAFNFVAEVGAAALTAQDVSKAPPPQPGMVATGGVGATYVFDVVRWVPYAGALIGPAYFANARVTHPFWTPDAQLAVGLDYELSRSWAVGVEYRQHLFFTKMSTYPEFTTLGLRFEYVWGW